MPYLAIWLPHFPWQALVAAQLAVADAASIVIEALGLERRVIAGSPAAAAAGIETGWSEAQARLRLPEVISVPRSPAAEQRLGAWMLEQLDRISDRCQPLPPDRWVLDLAGMESLLGLPGTIASRLDLRLRTQRLAPSLGLGATRTEALLHTLGAEPTAALPLKALEQLAGAGVDVAACIEVFWRWGLRTLGEIAALPARALRERLGEAGITCQRWARGEDQCLMLPAAPLVAPAEIEQGFEPPLEGYLPLLPWLATQLRAQCTALEAGGRAVSALALALRLEDAPTWQWRQSFPLPQADARRLERLLETALEQKPPGAPIMAARLRFTGLRPRRVQAGFWQDAQREAENRERFLARLRMLLDDPEGQRCGSPQLQDLHRSDAFRVVHFVPPPPPAAPAIRPALALKACRPPASIRLEFSRHPVASAHLRLEGAVCRLPRQGPRRIVHASGPWRNSGEWWTDQAWSLDEWDVHLEGSGLFRLRYDRRRRTWFLLGRYD